MASDKSKPELEPSHAISESPKNLEAHILRPHIESSKNSVVLSYKIEKHPWLHDALQAHLTSLESRPSLIDTIGNLLPVQARLILEFTYKHGGNLVFVEIGTGVETATIMSTFKMNSVIFVINLTDRVGNKKTVETKKSLHKYRASGGF